MPAKKSVTTVLVKMVSTAQTGFFYTYKKNPKRTQRKLQFRRYDPVVRQHVIFEESKMSAGCSSMVQMSLLLASVQRVLGIDELISSSQRYVTRHQPPFSSGSGSNGWPGCHRAVRDDKGGTEDDSNGEQPLSTD